MLTADIEHGCWVWSLGRWENVAAVTKVDKTAGKADLERHVRSSL